MRSVGWLGLIFTVGCSFAACGSNADGQPSSDQANTRKPTGPLRDVTCVDQSVAQLSLFDQPSDVAPKEEDKQNGAFHTFIDATGGGLEPSKSYVYARFTDQGLKPIAISDEDAFSSLDWDIAVRRYVIRLNSGVSGPSDVSAARTQPKTDFDSLKTVPSDLDYRTEEYFTDSCDFVSDGSGIGAPATALASFWSYQSCLAMTHNVYVLALPDANQPRHVKLEVLSYYTPDKQQTCDATGMVPMPSGAGNIRIRWAYLD